jgi:hypothetical protein
MCLATIWKLRVIYRGNLNREIHFYLEVLCDRLPPHPMQQWNRINVIKFIYIKSKHSLKCLLPHGQSPLPFLGA